MTTPLHPEVTIDLDGTQGHAFALASRTRTALRRVGVSNEDCTAFFNEALPDDHDDYNQVLNTVIKWVSTK